MGEPRKIFFSFSEEQVDLGAEFYILEIYVFIADDGIQVPESE